jgi:beta-lactamase class A
MAAGGAPLAQMEQLATPAAGQSVTPTVSPTVRHWDTNVAGIQNDPLLASRLDQVLSGVDGHVGVVVKDLGTGRGAVLNGDLELQSASLYKLPVLYSVFDLGLDWSEELTITDEALSYDSGTMELAAGETLSVAEAVERMVTLSDNTSAILLGGRVGAGNINANIASLGMDTTHYSLERMTTSAVDMAHFMELVADGKAVSRGASADMVHLLLRQRVNDRLPRLLPDSVQVAHKTGNLPGVVNDAGILYGPTSTVVVAALVSDTTDETAAATGIAQVAQVAEDYFGDEPDSPERPLIPPAPSRPVPPVHRESHPPTPTPTRAPAALVPTRAAIVDATPTAAAPTVAPTPVSTAVPTAKATLPPATPTPKPTPAPPTPTHTAVPTNTPIPATATPKPTVKPTATPVVPTPTPQKH